MNPAITSLAATWEWLLLTTLQACVIIALIRITQLLLRDRLAPRWHYALWLILLARMLTPWAPESELSLFNYVALNQPRALVTMPAPLPTPPHSESLSAQTFTPSESVPPDLSFLRTQESLEAPENTPLAQSPLPVTDTLTDRPDRSTTAAFPLPIGAILPTLWLLGASTLLTIVLYKNTRLIGAIRRAPVLADPRALAILDDCRATMGVRRPVRTAILDDLPSPALFGLFRPKLLLPAGLAETLPDDRLRYIFLHELGHYRRRDILINWLMTLLLTLHWFNPLVWYAFYRMRADRELACDALALSHTAPGESRDYGLTILELLERQSVLRQFHGAVGILEHKSHLKRRIAHIALFQKNSYRITSSPPSSSPPSPPSP